MEEVGYVVPRTAVPAECESVLVKESVSGRRTDVPAECVGEKSVNEEDRARHTRRLDRVIIT